MITYEVQCKMVSGEWENTNEETFATQAEAEADLIEFMDDCLYSVAMGYMEDFNASDWRVAECQYEEEEC